MGGGEELRHSAVPHLVFFLVFSSSCCRSGCSLALSSFSSPSSVLSRSRSIWSCFGYASDVCGLRV